jgi:uncharacterized protein YecE (DUF72 family)
MALGAIQSFRNMTQPRIGISGWRYGAWRQKFYPSGLPQNRELEFASRQFNSIELNGSFYSLQKVSSWERWYAETPEDFIFSVKGGRFITHMKKLKDVEKPLANFFAQGLLALKEKLGPIVWQFPPAFVFNPVRFEEFFQLLPRDMMTALKLARRRDRRMIGSSYLRLDKFMDPSRPLRYAVEIRHDSFDSPEFLKLLRSYGVALVVADTAGKWPFLERVTSDFVYARLHGDKELYVSGYSISSLDRWASRVRAWQKKRLDVYIYFDNDVKVHAPFDAIQLSQLVNGYTPLHPMATHPKGTSAKPRTSWPEY